VDSGNEGGIEQGIGRNSETGNGINEGIGTDGNLAEKHNGKPLSDESHEPDTTDKNESDNRRSTGKIENDMVVGQQTGVPSGIISPTGSSVGNGTVKGSLTGPDVKSIPGTEQSGTEGLRDRGNGSEHSLPVRGTGTEGNGEPNIVPAISEHGGIPGRLRTGNPGILSTEPYHSER
jgi:hypothetical protein